MDQTTAGVILGLGFMGLLGWLFYLGMKYR
jgi:hypothetical protein